MKAMVYRTYGAPGVVHLADVPKPVPSTNEVLIRIHATTVSTGDWRARSLDMPAGFAPFGRLAFGFFGPRQPILGTELSGVVEAAGAAVTRFTPGDEVFAFPGARFGGHAEYITLPETALIESKPAHLSFEEAAALSFGATTALPLLRKAGARRGVRVLVVGASGAVGSAAVQIAAHLGAEVTGVASGVNADLVRALGAVRAIDYREQDFVEPGVTYDVILDTTGTAPFRRVGPALAAGGRLVIVLGTFADALGLGRPPKSSGKHVVAAMVSPTAEEFRDIAAMAASGTLKPVIDRIYPLEDAAEAHAYVDSGRKRGSVVLTVKHPQVVKLAA